jgi:hypothetical protein
MTAKCKELRTTNATTCKAWNTYKMVLTITRDQFTAAIDEVYYAVLDNPTKGLNTINLCSLVIHILATYAQISQPDLDDNMTDFHSGINLGLPLAIYTRKQEKCQVFAADAGFPNSNETMITTGTKHARVWQHDVGLAQVETLPTSQPHLAQLEVPLDRCLCQNAQHQLNDCWGHSVWHEPGRRTQTGTADGFFS